MCTSDAMQMVYYKFIIIIINYKYNGINNNGRFLQITYIYIYIFVFWIVYYLNTASQFLTYSYLHSFDPARWHKKSEITTSNSRQV